MNRRLTPMHGPTVIPCDFIPTNPALHGRYLPIDLTANNRASIEFSAERRGITVEALLEQVGRERGTPPDFGWGVCRQGFGLQDFGDGYMNEQVATERAKTLNRGHPATNIINDSL
jgi:hypothetical protein